MIVPVRRVPLTVIGGFLGAGKTTLLNHWLRLNDAKAAPLRLAVLVNDFGSINVDAALIASRSADLIALTNGCVCCSIGDDLSAALIRVLESGTEFDAVVIEASGVSDPWRIAQIGLADRALSLGGVIALIDATTALAQSCDPQLGDSLVRTVRAADLLVLNKADLASAEELAAARAWLTELAPGTPCLEARNADLPLDLLEPLALPEVLLALPKEPLALPHEPLVLPQVHSVLRTTSHGAPMWGGGRGRPLDGPGVSVQSDGSDAKGLDHAARYRPLHPHTLAFDTWSATPDAVFEVDALRAWLRALPSGVLRLKGLVRSVEHGWTELQFAGRHSSVRPAAYAPDHGGAVVAIGLRGVLPVEALEQGLASLAG